MMNIEIHAPKIVVSAENQQMDVVIENPIIRDTPQPYAGEYTVQAGDADIVLLTNGLMMQDDVTVHPTPAYDGAYTVTPTDMPQTLHTNGLRMTADVVVAAGGGSATLIEKNITGNGVYKASDFGADGFSQVDVSVPQGLIIPTGFAYYNGFLLPKIPVDAEYKYTLIRKNNNTGNYDCIQGKSQWRARTQSTLDNWQLEFTNMTTVGTRQYSIPQDGSATDWGEVTVSTASYYGTAQDRKIIWSSDDIAIANSNNVLLRCGPAVE